MGELPQQVQDEPTAKQIDNQQLEEARATLEWMLGRNYAGMPKDLTKEMEATHRVSEIGDALLSRNFTELSLLELEVLEGILEHRIKYGGNLTESFKSSVSATSDTGDMGPVELIKNKLAEMQKEAESYPSDLKIVKALIEQRKAEEPKEEK